MKGLSGLIKIQESNLENRRKTLIDREKQKAIIEHQITELSDSIQREGKDGGGTFEAAAAFSAFLSGALSRKHALQAKVDALAIEVEFARDAVAEAFRDLKKFETAEAMANEREALRIRRREQSRMDEVGRAMRRRRDPTSAG